MREEQLPEIIGGEILSDEGSVSLIDSENSFKRIELVRSAVKMTKDATRAISITALETIREGAIFMGVIGSRGELTNPFRYIDAPIWEESQVPHNMISTAYDYCEELTRREAGNFYHSFKFLPDYERKAICAYYAFCRRADDIADGDFIDIFPGGSSDDPESIEYRDNIFNLSNKNTVLDRVSYNEKMSQLFYYRKKLSTAYQDVTSTDPIFMAIKDTVNNFGIPKQLLDDMVSGMEDDFHSNRYVTFEDLYAYCYRVASTVGLVCIEIYGYDNIKAKEYAESWGVFMQLVNILRDVKEDAERNRIYLPLDELAKYGITEDDILYNTEINNHPGWKPFVENYIRRANEYRDKAFKLLPLLDKSSRYSPAAMAAFYSSILKKIKKNDGDVFSKRIQLSKTEKILLAGYVYIRYRFLAV